MDSKTPETPPSAQPFNDEINKDSKTAAYLGQEVPQTPVPARPGLLDRLLNTLGLKNKTQNTNQVPFTDEINKDAKNLSYKPPTNQE